jgi:hypothetical protein
MVNMSNMTEELKRELAFTVEDLKELESAKKKMIIFDEDCPETTPERAVKFQRVHPPRRTVGADLAKKIEREEMEYHVICGFYVPAVGRVRGQEEGQEIEGAGGRHGVKGHCLCGRGKVQPA